uniref:Uncharacterized protein n=1 Tax=Trichobilharzia regenti TaxID=157069 RepID=A0AA85IS69_TRIRE|nr:unnamed protein product [Trichobilharzia regenti]
MSVFSSHMIKVSFMYLWYIWKLSIVGPNMLFSRLSKKQSPSKRANVDPISTPSVCL